MPSFRRPDSIPPLADDDPMSDEEPVDEPHSSTIFVTDPTVEAARIEWALRARGYVVIDVPLAMLVGRAAVQRPHLILLDVDAPGALETAARVRQLPGASGVHMIYAGHPGQTFTTSSDALAHEGSGFFARPIDVDALVEKIDALLGVGEELERGGAPSSPPAPSSTRNHAPRRSSRPPPPPPSLRAPASPLPPRPMALQGAGPVSVGPPLSNQPDVEAPSSSPAPSEPLSPRPTTERPPGARAWSNKAAEARLSPDLERLLREAEARVAGPTSQRAPESGLGGEDEVLSPEDEVEAVLPAEILASLDEPLDLDVDDGDSSGADTGAPQATTGRETRPKVTGRGTTAAVTTGGGGGGSDGGGGGASEEAETTGGGRDLGGSPVPPPVADPRTASTPRPPRRYPNPPADPRPVTAATTNSGASVGGDEDDERGRSQVSQQMAMPRPASEHPPPLAPTTARPPPPTPTQPRAELDRRTPPTPEVDSRPRAADPPLPATPRPAPVAPALPPARPITSPDEALRALAGAVASRITGVLRIDEAAGIRRIVLQDGDVVTAASSIEGESLLGYLQSRGDLGADVVKKLSGRVPPFGRLAGAALVAHGHLHQDQLWDVLQAHAAWLLTRAVGTARGQIAYELEPPARLKGEPPVFGGTPGPALVVEITRRAVPPPEAIGRLGGLDARLTGGERQRLIDECGLEDADDEVLRRAAGASLRDVVAARGEDSAPLVYALVALGVLGALPAARPISAGNDLDDLEAIDPVRDAELDDGALRARIGARRALVEDGDYFAILGVARIATGYEIRRAYLDLRRALEPSRVLRPSLGDMVDDLNLVLQVIDEAYDVLKDPTRRDRYRRAISHEPPQA